MALDKNVDPQVLARIQAQARELHNQHCRQSPITTLTKPRAESLALLEAWTASESLRKHALAVEAAMTAYARKLGQDEALWATTGLLHDFDYEKNPTIETQDIIGGPGGQTVSYSYDPDGNLGTMVYPDGTLLTNSYTARNQLATITQNGQLLVTYGYNGNGYRESKVFNGGTTTYTYDSANQLSTLNSSLSTLTYGYYPSGNRQYVQRDGISTDTYYYDQTEQLTSVQYAGDRNVTYGYDNVGNRTNVNDSTASPANTVFAVNNLNQYTSVSTNALSYGANGNLTQLSTTNSQLSLAYDSLNRLISAQSASSAVQFRYDARNRCVARTVNGTNTFLYYNGWHLIEERDASGNEIARYVHGAAVDEILTLTIQPSTLNQTVFYHHDGLGSVTHLTDGSGNVVEKYTYDVFGAATILDSTNGVRSASAVGNRFMFAGREYLSEIALYDYRNRAYSPSLGRFLQPDPIRFRAEDVNLYRYVGNNPLNGRDPLGLRRREVGNGWCIDDAGRKCCCKDIKEITLFVDTTDIVGHGYVSGPNGTRGHHPVGEQKVVDYFFPTASVPGTAQDDATGYARSHSETYDACPETVQKFNESIKQHGKDRYHAGNMTARNCIGWACERLSDAGISPPFPANTPWLRPHSLLPSSVPSSNGLMEYGLH